MKKGQAITARLVVRRVRDLNKKTADGQDELFPVWRYHAVFTDSPFELVIQAEAQHRDHAIAEQVFADVTSGPLRHGHQNPAPRPRTRTSRRTGEQQDAHARIHFGNSSCRNRTGTGLPGISRWSAAKAAADR